MINNLFIDNFKCHSNLNLPLSNLNLLVGTNSSGKSSIIQSLLLASHNVSDSQSSPLNGHLVSIGNFKEARNYVTNAKTITIRMSFNDENLEIDIHEDESSEDGKFKITTDSPVIRQSIDYSKGKLHYLSSHRIGGQDLYNKNFDRYDRFGIFGEYAIDYYQLQKTEEITDPDLIITTNSLTLEGQVNYWLQFILNHELNTSTIPGTDKIKADFTNKANKIVRPKNTGSGVSYLMNIIITCLSSKKGDIVMIENPEIHLHPKAQSQLSEFFVFIANAGIQLIIETHSDHIFNGARVQIFHKKITTNKIRVHFFDLDERGLSSKHTIIDINDQGRIENQEELLFDQFDNDVNSLLGLW